MHTGQLLLLIYLRHAGCFHAALNFNCEVFLIALVTYLFQCVHDHYRSYRFSLMYLYQQNIDLSVFLPLLPSPHCLRFLHMLILKLKTLKANIKFSTDFLIHAKRQECWHLCYLKWRSICEVDVEWTGRLAWVLAGACDPHVLKVPRDHGKALSTLWPDSPRRQMFRHTHYLRADQPFLWKRLKGEEMAKQSYPVQSGQNQLPPVGCHIGHGICKPLV